VQADKADDQNKDDTHSQASHSHSHMQAPQQAQQQQQVPQQAPQQQAQQQQAQQQPDMHAYSSMGPDLYGAPQGLRQGVAQQQQLNPQQQQQQQPGMMQPLGMQQNQAQQVRAPPTAPCPVCASLFPVLRGRICFLASSKSAMLLNEPPYEQQLWRGSALVQPCGSTSMLATWRRQELLY
jgi:hypothetical protein